MEQQPNVLPQTMISIVISEKGGAERREQYDQNEVTIGRVKGNDLLLPKGNVSKRHARLIVRDGRYIVTDLKSTNGTYVNHRRITHATLVREGDRIYIGDFVLRIEGGPSRPPPPGFEASSPSPAAPDSTNHPARVPSGGHPAASAPPHDLLPLTSHEDVVSHFPIERDPDESSPLLDVPGPPRVPSGFRPGASGATPVASSLEAPHTRDSRSSSPSISGSLSSDQTPAMVHSSRPAAEDAQSRTARQAVLEQLVGRVENEIGAAALAVALPPSDLVERVKASIERHLGALIEEGLPVSVDPEVVREAAIADTLELGPLGGLIDDENISEIQVLVRRVAVHRRGRRALHAGSDFAGDASVARAVERLYARLGVDRSGASGPYVRTRLADGRELVVAEPKASLRGHLLVIKRPRRSTATIDGLVRSGAISRGMATLLSHCVATRANILVTGDNPTGTRELVTALVGAVPRDATLLFLVEEGAAETIPESAPMLALGADVESRRDAIRTAAHFGADHLVVPPIRGEELALLMDLICEGSEGVLLAAGAGTLRQALARLSSEIARARAGVSVATARDWLGACFDLALEVTRLRDGRLRVLRLAELRAGPQGAGLHDIFTFAYHRTAAGGSIEGAFYASGTVPRIVEDLAARGLPLDTTIFRRHPST
jgi:pilus assembly protein CpaF